MKIRAWDNVKDRMYYAGEEDDVVFHFESNGIVATDITEDEEEFRTLRHLKYMQYTGLKDSNGNEIYDGDIVKISGHPFQGSIDIDGNYVVGYNELMELSCGGWYLHRMRHWAEVIGNKFENPELLQGGNK
ncbi:YopX family protein [Bacillus toyonensis]|uniref:YopX family protein n=1 Tax=Bacillus toyonensis TaxID=155322 RepID=UPI00211D1C8C|nr:YopX family protein [Bacillus toyonensis]